MKFIFSKLLLVVLVATFVASTTTAATTVYASNQKSSPSSDSSSAGSGSIGSDNSGSSSSGSTGSQSSGPGNTPQSPQLSQAPVSSSPTSTPSQQQQLSQPQLLQKPCPDGSQQGSSGKCPPLSSTVTPKGHTADFGIGFSAGKEDGKNGVYDPAAACAGATNQAHCIQGYKDAYVGACVKGKFGCGDGPSTCTSGEKCVVPSPTPCGDNGAKCLPPPPPGPSLPEHCRKIKTDNTTTIFCPPRTIEHNTHTTITQIVPGLATNTNDINLMIVTTCTADQNNGVLSGNLAALCDSTITMMHNDGLNSLLPQVDLYLKARGLLQ